MKVQVLVNIGEILCVIQTESQHVQNERIMDAMWLEGTQKILAQSKVAPECSERFGHRGFLTG